MILNSLCPKLNRNINADPAFLIGFRLSIITKSKLDGIKEHMPRPRGSVPVIALPSWKKMSLDNKIPRLPGNDFFFSFTRGQIGDSVNEHPLYKNLFYCSESFSLISS